MLQRILFIGHQVVLHHGGHVAEQGDVLFAQFFIGTCNQTIHQKGIGRNDLAVDPRSHNPHNHQTKTNVGKG